MRVVFFTLLCLIICLPIISSAQTAPPPVSAAALAYGKYADIPVNHFTGTGNVNVPLATVSDGPISLPLSLDYHTVGQRVAEPATAVGLGWNLSAGGMITRVVRGLPDEADDGYLKRGHEIRIPGDSGWHPGQRSYDSEPDLFTYNVGGTSGKFIVDIYGEIGTVKMIPRSDVKVEFTTSTNGSTFTSFKVTLPNGVAYFFGKNPFQSPSEPVLADRVSTNVNTNTPPSGWFLKSIRSADGVGFIDLNYEDNWYAYQVPGVCPEEVKYRKNGSIGSSNIAGCTGGNGNNVYQVRSHVLKSVTNSTNTQTIQLITDSRYDVGGNTSAKRITEVQVENGAFCNRFVLEQDYFVSDLPTQGYGAVSAPGYPSGIKPSKLRLKSVRKFFCGSSDAVEPAWEFEYNGRTTTGDFPFAPQTANWDIDHWGFYNLDPSEGTNNGALDLTPPQVQALDGTPTQYGDANRTSHEQSMLTGSLRKVTYPTGGSMTLDYEANRHYVPGDVVNALSLNYSFSENQNGSISDPFSYSNVIANSSVQNWVLVVTSLDDLVQGDGGTGGVTITNSSGVVVSSLQLTADAGTPEVMSGTLPIVGNSPSDSPLQAGETYTIQISGSNAQVTFNIEYQEPVTEEAICGGLRISRTRVHDGLSSDRDIVKDYLYTAEGSSLSSGNLFRTPTYSYRINTYSVVFSAYSHAPLSDFEGYHLGYERVVVDLNGIGHEEYHYNFVEESAPSQFFPQAPVDYRVGQGALLNSASLDEQGTVIQSSVIERNEADQNTQISGCVALGVVYSKRYVSYWDGSDVITSLHYNEYAHHTNVYRPGNMTTVVDGVTSQVDYEYEGSHTLRPYLVTTENSNGDQHATQNIDIHDYPVTEVRDRCIDLNMVYLPYRQNQLVNEQMVSGSEHVYKFFDANGLNPNDADLNGSGGILTSPLLYQTYSHNRTYDAAGNLTPIRSELEMTIEEYTPEYLVARTVMPNWEPTTYSYDSQNRLRTKTVKDFTTAYDYYPDSDLLQSKTNIDGTTFSYTYDGTGRLRTTSDDCRGLTTTYAYEFDWGGLNLNLVESTVTFSNVDARSEVTQKKIRNYKDGLGRDVQRIAVNLGVGDDDDILYSTEYDQYGRVWKTFEPHLRVGNFGNYRPWKDSWGYSETEYEDSPLSRVTESIPYGWHSSTYKYGNNSGADQVVNHADGGTYPVGSLVKKVSVDPDGKHFITFTDKLGRQVLIRRSDATDSPTSRLDTYTIYDGKSRVKMVLPPGAQPKDDELIYAYDYDDEDKLVYKKIPGRAASTYFYNDRDLLGAYRDGSLLAGSSYGYNYDDYGRQYEEGIIKGGGIPTDFDVLGINTVLVETDYGTAPHEVDKIKTVRTKVLETSDWLITNNFYSTCGLLETQTGNNHLDLTASEGTMYAYDGANNVVASTYDHVVNGTTRTIRSEHHFDHAGRNVANYFGPEAGSLTQFNEISYDLKGRAIQSKQGRTTFSSSDPRAFLQQIDYSYLDNGMLKGINLNGNAPLSGNQVALPAHSSMATMPSPGAVNASDADDKDLFQLELYRDETAPGLEPIYRRKNGNVTAVATQVRGRQQQVWNVRYDDYDRLTEARLYERTDRAATAVPHYTRSTVSYDERGNIQTLYRRQNTKHANQFYFNTQTDNLRYDYPHEIPGGAEPSNHLLAVDDLTNHAHSYREGTGNYQYDASGNMTYDPSKGITVAYNHLDLPTTITWDDSDQRIEFVYDASGTLLSRRLFAAGNTSGVPDKRYDFVGGLEYEDQALHHVTHEEGRVLITETGYEWQYVLTDHLGNTRLMYADRNGNGIPEVTNDQQTNEILQEVHYWPFGMKMTGPWLGSAGSDNQTRHQYNGIEHVTDFDLGIDMAMYRTLDPAIGRWWSVDPKAEKYINWTPYNSMGNSPMVQIDPNGDALPFLAIVGIGAAIFGTGNLAAQAAAGNINNFGDGLEAFGTGAVAGAALTAGYTVGLGVPVLGPILKGTLAAKATTTGLSLLGGTVRGIASGDWSGVGNAGEIFLGNFYSDSERGPISQILQLTSRHSWELIQTEIGHSYSQLRNFVGGVDRVDLYRGATFTQRFNSPNGFGGVSLGNFINIGTSGSDPNVTLENEPDRGFRPGLLRHEYGHIFDSHRWGPLYLFRIGIPNAADSQWTEDRADRFWRSYFSRNP